jgi:DNA-binding protein YbaB
MSSPNGIGGGLMRDPEQAIANIDAWAQGLAEKATRYQAAHERTEEIRLTAATSDGSVRVTVRADGSVTGLELAGSARTMPLEELSAQILATMRRAQAKIADQVATVLTEEIGAEDPQTRTAMVSELRSRFPDPDVDEDEPAPEEPRDQAGGGDEEDDLPW